LEARAVTVSDSGQMTSRDSFRNVLYRRGFCKGGGCFFLPTDFINHFRKMCYDDFVMSIGLEALLRLRDFVFRDHTNQYAGSAPTACPSLVPDPWRQTLQHLK